MKLEYIKLHPDAKEPRYSTDGAACFDLFAVGDGVPSEAVDNAVVYRTGLSFVIPEGWCLKVFSRSGQGFNLAQRLINCTGIIDSDYTGELKVCVVGDGRHDVDLKTEKAICQVSLEPVTRAEFVEVKDHKKTDRGDKGFGSTDNGLWYPPQQEGFGPWIEWNGGNSPVSENTCVQFLLSYERNQKKYTADVYKSKNNYWVNDRDEHDIVAYCVKQYNPQPLESSDGSKANYYDLPQDSKILQDLISFKDMNAQIGEIFREAYRYGEASHSSKIRGIKKILFYAQAELERLEKYGDA